MKNPSPNNPNTIEGTPARLLMAPRITRVTGEPLRAYSVRYSAVITPTGTTQIVINTTSAAVPKIIGNTPALSALNMPSFVPPKMKCSDTCAAPLPRMSARITRIIPKIAAVAAPVATVNARDCNRLVLRESAMTSATALQPHFQPVHHEIADDIGEKRHHKQHRPQQKQDAI